MSPTTRLTISGVHAQAWLDALDHNCTCTITTGGTVTSVCSLHRQDLDERSITHMEFGKYLAETNALDIEEWRVDIKDALRQPPAEEPEPHMLSEFSYQILKAADLR